MVVSKRCIKSNRIKLLQLEMCRMLKTSRIKLLIVLSLFLSVVMAYLPVTFETIKYANEIGEIVELKGMEAVRYKKALQENIKGVVTAEKVQTAVEEYQNVLREYHVKEYYELPDEIYTEKIFPYVSLVKGVREIFANPSTGMAPNIMEIEPEEIGDYYLKCEIWLEHLMNIEQEDNVSAQNFAKSKYHSIEKPFVFYPGTSRNAIDYQVLLTLILLIFCTIIAAPVFSSDYQTGADDIFRSTRNGRGYFAGIKIVTTIGLCSFLFLICLMIYLFVSNSLFGWECLKTSVQMIYSIVNLAHFNIGELQAAMVCIGLLAMIATIGVTLFFSSKSKNVVASLALGFTVCIAPLFVYMAIHGKAGLWVTCMLPSASVGLQTSFLYQVIDFQFLNIGRQAIWTPYMMIAFILIEIPLFLWCTIYSYLNYRAR